ncbi:chromosome segregation and condensation protein ScpB [Deferribacter desulfuricans SSM1]|uniref:Chromosome segregation and condensation protein ScpB n=1 Tax=Deferribacter desulfuricans (strain DSM 14783 / JCM 11476 / NBRC 101012 / SSM1) TaxID=639282 RepID=D3PD02_DEFDS|nr:SMC-Scp complex subunit ScpB [Deferribacter desulfuricans]BAI80475.1 chromosome segregation and condensation protein ScpB [Deferribacter desulfuricans SSM1]
MDEKKLFFATLFLSGKPVTVKTLRQIMEPVNLENRLTDYVEYFNKLDLGIKIIEVAGGYQMVADSKLYSSLIDIFGEKTENFSRATLETLAVIAYKQPITKAEIEQIRGVNSSSIIRNLLDKGFVKIIGRKDVPGKPLLYCTTNKFLEYFGLKDLSELPTFREWQELKRN